jgi:hypothetical protein
MGGFNADAIETLQVPLAVTVTPGMVWVNGL